MSTLPRIEPTATAAQQVDQYAPLVEFGILGPLQVRSGDVLVDIRRGLPRTILTYLLLHVGDTVRSDVLADVLWGDQQPANPANALQTQISYLRRQLAAHATTQPIVTRPGGYTVDIDRETVDAHRFDRIVHSAASLLSQPAPDPTTALETLDGALIWWRGEALEDVAGEPFAIGEAGRLEELRLTAIELRHDAALLLGRHREVAGDLAALVQEHPLREKLHEQLMLALYRSGRQAEALRAFAFARERLVDELGIEPGPDLQDLERRILDHDPTLVLPSPPVHVAAVPAAVAVVSSPRPASLPAPVTPLIGREVELGRVASLLERSRAVTLTGPAGAGKSRLAIEAARSASTTCEVWYVDLGDLVDPAQVALEVAGAIAVPTVPNEDPINAVSVALSARSGVLVLDTCEHVVGAVAVLVGRLLRDAPDIRVLSTSRRPINVNGEIAWPVPPLALAGPGVSFDELCSFPSIELFVRRAQAVQPDFELTGDNAPDVIAICMALDGLPLAIELAAARVDVLAPRLIRERLTRRFDLLVDGGRDTRVRQQTLRGAIDWSIDLLDERQRACFARLGVLVGGFDLETAGCVAAIEDADELFATMTSLVRHSMVARLEGERFRLLDTLRAYSLEMLDDIDADATRDRHARCFTRLAEEGETAIRGQGQITGLERVRADLPNHRAALDWLVTVGDGVGAARLAGALGWFWTLDGSLADACTQLGTILAFPELPAPERAKVSWSLALVVASLGELRRAEELARRAIDCGREAEDLVQVGLGLNALAVAQWGLGDLDGAEASRDEAIRLFDEHSEPWGAAVSRVLRGRTALDRGSPDTGELVAEGLAAAEAIGDRHLIGMAHEQVARLALRRGDLDTALASADLALRQHSEIGYAEGGLGARHIRGSALRERGELDAAMGEHLAALRSAQAIDHRAVLCEALEDVALVHHAAGRAARAQELVDLAGEERCRLGLARRADDAARLIEGLGAVRGVPGRCEDVAGASGRAKFDAVVAQLLADRTDTASTA